MFLSLYLSFCMNALHPWFCIFVCFVCTLSCLINHYWFLKTRELVSEYMKEYNSSRFMSDMVMKSISRDNLLLIFHSISGASRTRDEGIEESDNRKTAFFCIIWVAEKVWKRNESFERGSVKWMTRHTGHNRELGSCRCLNGSRKAHANNLSPNLQKDARGYRVYKGCSCLE